MTDDQFKALCNTFGFAPSRALRELIDCATARAEAQRDALLEACKAALSDDQPYIEKCRAAIAKVEENT